MRMAVGVGRILRPGNAVTWIAKRAKSIAIKKPCHCEESRRSWLDAAISCNIAEIAASGLKAFLAMTFRG